MLRREILAGALCGALLAVSAGCALAMRVAHLSSDNLLGFETYNSVFAAHGAPTIVLMPALLLLVSELASGASREGSRVANVLASLAWAGLSISAVAVAVVTLGGTSEPQSVPGSDFLAAALLVSTLLVAACLTTRVAANDWRGGAVALAGGGIVHLFGIGLAPLGVLTSGSVSSLRRALLAMQSSWSSVSSDVLAIAALATIVDALDDREEGSTRRLVVGALFACTLMPRVATLADGAVMLAKLTTGAWLVSQVLRASPAERGRTTMWLYSALAAVTWFEGTVAREFLRALSTDIHLNDTYFVVGVFHLQIVSVLFALVALLHRGAPGGTAAHGRRQGALAGAFLSLVGSHAFHGALLWLGARGMPRRYANYLPEFQSLQGVATVGAFLLVSGIAIGAAEGVARLRNLRARPPRLESSESDSRRI